MKFSKMMIGKLNVRTLPLLVLALMLALPALASFPKQTLATPPTPVLDYNVNYTFSGASPDYFTKTSDLPSVASLSQGSIVARFKTTSTAAVKTILSASDTNDNSSNITLAIANNKLYFEVRENGSSKTSLAYPVSRDVGINYNDGNYHTVAVTVGSTGTKIYADGHQVHAGTSTAFFDDVLNLNGMWIGRNVDNVGAEWYYNGTIDTVKVYNSVLSDADVLTLSAAPTVLKDYTINQSFNGTSDYVDKTADVSSVSALTRGTIYAEFSTTSTAAAKTLLSASHTTDPSSNITLSVNNGNLYYECRENGTYVTQLTANANLNDGNTHKVAVTVGDSGTRLFIDGYQAAFVNTTGFFSSVLNLDGMWVGRNVDNGGGQWYFNGTINKVKIYNYALTDSEIKHISGTSPMSFVALYDNGYSGSHSYRIPALYTTTAGTLIAGVDQRVSSEWDSPNDINFGIRRSTDGGNTWGSFNKLLDYPGTGSNGASAIDSAIVQNASTGRIFIAVDMFPGGTGQGNNTQETGFDSNGYQILYDAATMSVQNTMRPDGSGGYDVYNSSGIITSYKVNSSGNVTLSGSPKGNIYLKKGVDPNESYLIARTSFLILIYSDDDGVTWSNPIHLNPQVKASWMDFIGTAPGRGIQLTQGTHAGRLLIPIYFGNVNNVYSSAVIYSDDNGATWTRGESPNDGRSWGGGTITAQNATVSSQTLHENQLVERNDGTIIAYMRNLGASNVATATSSDGGATWSDVIYDTALPEIFNNLTAIKGPNLGDGIERVLFANAIRKNSNNNRTDGVVRLSLDGGATWSKTKMIKSGSYSYSSMTILPNGDIGLYWEIESTGLFFSKFPLSWLTN